MRQRAHRDAGPGLRDDRAAPRQQLLLRDPALYTHMGRLRPELGRVDLPPRRHHHRHAEGPQPRERAREQVARLRVEDRAQGQMHGVPGGRRRIAPAERERSGRLACARRERRQHRLVRRLPAQPVRRPQRRQRGGDHLVGDQTADGHQHAGARQTEPLGGDPRPEVDLVADDRAGAPLAGEAGQRLRPPPGERARVPVAQRTLLLGGVVGPQRQARRRVGLVARRLQRGEPALLDRAQQLRAARHRDVVARRRRGPRQRHERVEMALPAGEGEQDAHYASAAIDAATSATIPSREPADA